MEDFKQSSKEVLWLDGHTRDKFLETIGEISSPGDFLRMRSMIDRLFPNDDAIKQIDSFTTENRTADKSTNIGKEQSQEAMATFSQLAEEYDQLVKALNQRLVSEFPTLTELKDKIKHLSEFEQIQLFRWWGEVSNPDSFKGV